MYLEIFLADFAAFCVFWGISGKCLNFTGLRPREISEALPSVAFLYLNDQLQMVYQITPVIRCSRLLKTDPVVKHRKP